MKNENNNYANEITNISGSSEVISFSAVTYSNESKIRFGVKKEIIDKYTVYSKEVAKEMSKVIQKYTNSNIAIGITGKLNRIDENNPYGKNNEVFYCIYDKDNKRFIENKVEVLSDNRIKNKKKVSNKISKELINILK